MRWLLFALLLTSCGGAPTTPEASPPDARPRLDGVLVLDTPIESAPEDAQVVWETAERMLEDRGPIPPPDLGLDDYMNWMRGTWAPWLEGRVATLRDLRERFADLAEVGARERIFAAVVAGYLYEDFARLIEGLPVPVEVEGDREMSAAFASQLRAQAAPAWTRAHEAWSSCVEWAPDAPEALRSWGDACARRLSEVPEIAEAPSAPQAVAWPEECTTRPEPAANVAPTRAGPVALLVRDRGPLTEAEGDRLAEAVYRHVRRTHRGVRLLRLRDIRSARALATRSESHQRLSCARAPSTLAVLRGRTPSVVRGSISASCYYRADERVCRLDVFLGNKPDGAPLTLGAQLDEVSIDIDEWVVAVDALSEEGAMSSILGQGRGHGVGGPVQAHFVTEYGDWGETDILPIIRTAETALGPCRDVDDSPADDMDIVLEVMPDGAVSDVSLASGPQSERRRDCVGNALEDIEFPASSGVRRVTFRLAFYPEGAVALPYRANPGQVYDSSIAVDAAFGDRSLRNVVARCYAGLPVAHESVASYRATISVTPAGTVDDVNVEGVTVPDGVGEAVRECVATALQSARFACHVTGEATTVEATVCIGGR